MTVDLMEYDIHSKKYRYGFERYVVYVYVYMYNSHRID